MLSHRNIMLWSGTVALLLLARPAAAEEVAAKAPGKEQAATGGEASAGKGEFLRLVRDAKQTPAALETAVVTFAPEDRGKTGPTVDLVAAVHIGDKAYYQQLNKLFSGYDAVLYEIVAPKGTRIPKGGGKNNNPVSMIQVTLTRVLELSFQLEEVDYTKENMVHADMSPAEFSKSMKDRGESPATILMRLFAHAMAQQEQTAALDARMILALLNKDRALALKRLMAEQFCDLEGSILAIDGKTGSALITDRNKFAIEELRKAIGGGKKKIAIFYGAAHMPDFQKRLKDQFQFVPVRTDWLVAWDIKEKVAAPAGKPSAGK